MIIISYRLDSSQFSKRVVNHYSYRKLCTLLSIYRNPPSNFKPRTQTQMTTAHSTAHNHKPSSTQILYTLSVGKHYSHIRILRPSASHTHKHTTPSRSTKQAGRLVWNRNDWFRIFFFSFWIYFVPLVLFQNALVALSLCFAGNAITSTRDKIKTK